MNEYDSIPTNPFDFQFEFPGQCNTPRPAAGLGVASVDRYCGITLKWGTYISLYQAHILSLNFLSSCVQILKTEDNGYIKNTATDIGTVCTSTKPFQVCIKTDDVEGAIGAASDGMYYIYWMHLSHDILFLVYDLNFEMF